MSLLKVLCKPDAILAEEHLKYESMHTSVDVVVDEGLVHKYSQAGLPNGPYLAIVLWAQGHTGLWPRPTHCMLCHNTYRFVHTLSCEIVCNPSMAQQQSTDVNKQFKLM